MRSPNLAMRSAAVGAAAGPARRLARRLTGGLAIALALLTATAASAASEDARFDFYVSGIKAGEMSLDTTQTGGDYTARSRIDAAGFLGMLLTFFYEGTASGRVDAKGAVVPTRFVARSKTPRTDRRTEIDWKGGVPSRISVEPARENAPDPAMQGGTVDPISAGFSILRDLPRNRICDTTLMVYDGSRLSRLRLDAAVASGGKLTCAGNYARIEGEAHTLSDQREFPFKLIFGEQADGIARLERIETSTTFGLAVLERRG